MNFLERGTDEYKINKLKQNGRTSKYKNFLWVHLKKFYGFISKTSKISFLFLEMTVGQRLERGGG